MHIPIMYADNILQAVLNIKLFLSSIYDYYVFITRIIYFAIIIVKSFILNKK